MLTAVYRGDPTQDERYKQAAAYGWVQAWQRSLDEESGLAPRTRLDYLRSVAVFVVQHDRTDWTHHDVLETLVSFPAGSRRKVRAHLNSFLQWLEDEDLIDKNPMRKIRRQKASPQRVPDEFTEADLVSLLALPVRDSSLMALMFYCGLRKGECRRLQRRHINLDTAELTVMNGKGGKSRVIPLNVTAQKAIADLDLIERIAREDFLWYGTDRYGHVDRTGGKKREGVGEATFQRWWVRCLKQADVLYVPRCLPHEPGVHNPHSARHSFATRYLREGGRLSTLRIIMGHSSVSTTVDLYAHLDLSDARTDVLLLDTVSV